MVEQLVAWKTATGTPAASFVWPIILKATAFFGTGRSHSIQATIANNGKQHSHKRFTMPLDA